MTWLERRITQARHRLWVNRWFRTASRSITALACVYAVVILLQRVFELPLPLSWTGLVLGGVALIASLTWARVTRESTVCAAARLDEAAGLRERLSSGWYCRELDDPFARAVVADAERTSSSLTTGSHIRLQVPKAGLLAGASVMLAAMMFLVEPGLLRSDEAEEAAAADELVTQTKLAVRRKLDAVARMTEANPALNDLDSDVKSLDSKVLDPLRGPVGIRHEAVKKIDRLSDAVRDKRNSLKYDGVRAVQKMMRGLKTSAMSQAPTQKLARALRRGDLKAARKEMQAIKEILATLKFDEDQELVASMTKQLEALSKQLDKLAKNDKLAEKLVRAGIKPTDARRMLEHLKKKDLDQLRKSLEDRGLNQQQVNKLLQQVLQHQQARDPARKLAQGMKLAASAAAAGKAADAVAGLSMAEGQLSELEMLEQEMNGLDGALAELQRARNDIDRPCPTCRGTGMRGGQPCARCGGQGGRPGPGQGRKPGQGRGGLAAEQETDVAFKTERVKVHTGKGAIIGQMLVDGEQAKGEVTTALARVANAAERAASDRINRDRVPRQYQSAVKAYFATVKEYGVESEEESADASSGSTDGKSDDR